jgi:hypothetical protein
MRTRATFAVALAAAMLAAAGCGGSDGSGNSSASEQASATQAMATTAVKHPPAKAPGGETKPKAKSSAPHHAKASGKRAAKTALHASAIKAVTASAPARPKTGSAPSGAGSKSGSGRTRNGGGGHDSSGPADHGGKKKNGHKGLTAAVPTPPPLPNAGLPPGTSVFDLARQMCGDPRNLQFLTPDQRNDPESVAVMAETFAPSGHEQEAHDGCLAGLHDQGIG